MLLLLKLRQILRIRHLHQGIYFHQIRRWLLESTF